MRRIALLILILAAALSACQSGPVQALQAKWKRAIRPCSSVLYPGNSLWSMDNTKIAYASLTQNGEITHFAFDFSRRHTSQLTNDAYTTVQGVKAWSRDRSHLIIVTADETKLLKTDGTGEMISLSILGQAPSASWSPTGDQILYISLVESLDYAIFVGSPTEKDWTPILNDQWLDKAKWSPDAKRIATLRADMYEGIADLAVVNVDGTGLARLTNGANIVGEPEWSPDGVQIAFLNGSAETVLNIINADGSGLRSLTAQAGWPFVWNADGSGLIAYHASQYNHDGNDGSIVRVDLNGHTTILINIAKYAPQWPPAFSPDGTKIAFVRSDTPYPDLYVMNVDGTNLVRLTHNPGYNTCFNWPF